MFIFGVTKANDMKNSTPFYDSMIAKFTEQVELLSPNEFGKYPYSKEALEMALSELQYWQGAKYKAEVAPVTGTCGIVKSHMTPQLIQRS